MRRNKHLRVWEQDLRGRDQFSLPCRMEVAFRFIEQQQQWYVERIRVLGKLRVKLGDARHQPADDGT